MGIGLDSMKLRNRLALLVVAAFLGIALVIAVSLVGMRGRLMEEKRLKTRHVVETAYGVLEAAYASIRDAEEASGKAQSQALAALRTMRYEGQEYFWVNDMNAVMVMHPFKPEMEGKDQGDY